LSTTCESEAPLRSCDFTSLSAIGPMCAASSATSCASVCGSTGGAAGTMRSVGANAGFEGGVPAAVASVEIGAPRSAPRSSATDFGRASLDGASAQSIALRSGWLKREVSAHLTAGTIGSEKARAGASIGGWPVTIQ